MSLLSKLAARFRKRPAAWTRAEDVYLVRHADSATLSDYLSRSEEEIVARHDELRASGEWDRIAADIEAPPL